MQVLRRPVETTNLEMRLFCSEPENGKRDLYTFECVRCSHIEVKGVLVA